MGELMSGIKHFKLTTEAVNIFEEEQTLQFTEIILCTHAASKAPVDPSQDACKATADAWSEYFSLTCIKDTLVPTMNKSLPSSSCHVSK